jgi:hypothetical protein
MMNQNISRQKQKTPLLQVAFFVFLDNCFVAKKSPTAGRKRQALACRAKGIAADAPKPPRSGGKGLERIARPEARRAKGFAQITL